MTPKACPLRVLVVDDERDTVDTLMEILRDEGHVAHGVYTGRDALPTALIFRPDAILVDIAIPGVSGYAVAQSIHYGFTVARRPLLIAISGVWRDKPDLLLAERVGFDHHLCKPCGSTDILKLLEPLHTRGNQLQ